MKNVGALQVFGKILTKENITLNVDSNASTAFFDLNKRILTIPEFSFDDENFTKMLISHECAHAIFTSYDGWMAFLKKHKSEPRAKSYLNIVEDCRIDRLIQERHSGLKQTYTLSAKYIIESNFLGIKKEISKYSFMNRLNIHFKTKFYMKNYNVVFSADEQTYVDRIAKIKTWDEVCQITEEVLAKFQENNDEDVKALDDFDESVDSTQESKETEETEKKKFRGRFDLDEGDGDEKREDVEDEEKVSAPGMDFGVETYENLLKGIKGGQSNVNIAVNYRRSSGTTILKEAPYTELGTLTYPKTFDTVSPNARRIIQQYKSWVNLFASRFEQKKRGREIQKTMFNRTGMIDPMKMIYHKITEDIFRTNVVEEKQKNHGFVVLIDCSGSMSSIFSKVIEQFYAIYAVCAHLGIPFKGFGFTTKESYSAGKKKYPTPVSGGETLEMYNFFDTSKSKAYNQNVLSYLVSGQLKLGGTPLSDAIYNMIPQVAIMKRKMGIDLVNLIVLTDGGDGGMNVREYINYQNMVVPTGLSTRGNYDNTNALYSVIRKVYGVNVTCIDINGENISSANFDSKDRKGFSSKEYVVKKDVGGVNNCVVISPNAVSSSNKQIVKVLSDILS